LNSDDDGALEDVKPDVEEGMYTAEMNPKKGPMKLTQTQAAHQRAAGQAVKTLKVPPQSQLPVPGSSDDDDTAGSEWIWSQTKGCMRKNRHFRDAEATAQRKGTPLNSDNEDQEEMTEDQKRYLNQGKRKSAKAPEPPRSMTPISVPPRSPVPVQSAPPRASTPVKTISVPPDPFSPKGVKKGAGKKAATKPAVPEATQPKST
jgi:hypothetical protein